MIWSWKPVWIAPRSGGYSAKRPKDMTGKDVEETKKNPPRSPGSVSSSRGRMGYATPVATPKVPYYKWDGLNVNIPRLISILGRTHRFTIDNNRISIVKTDGSFKFAELEIGAVRYLVREGDKLHVMGEYEFRHKYQVG